MKENILFLSHIKLPITNYAVALGIKVYAKFLNCSVLNIFDHSVQNSSKWQYFRIYYTSVYFKRKSNFTASYLCLCSATELGEKTWGNIHAEFMTL